MKTRGPVWQVAAYIKPYRRDAIIAPLLMVLEVSMDLTLPFLMERMIDVGIAQQNLQVVMRTGLIMAVCACIGAVGGIGCTIFAVRVAMSYGADVRSSLFRKVHSLSFGNFDRLGTGNLITRLTNDVTQLQDAVLMSLRILVRSPALVVGSLVMAVITSPRLAPLLVVLVPLLSVILVIVIRKSWPLFSIVQSKLDRMNTTLQENLAGVRVVKAFVRGPYEQQRFGAANEEYRASSVAAMQVSASVGPIMMLLLNFGIAAAIWFGGVQVDRGTMTVGEIVAFTNYLRYLLFSLMMVSMLLVQLSRAGASAHRVVEVLNSRADVADPAPEEAAPVRMGPIAFENVSLSYDGGEPVLQDLSFVAQPGQTVAILGATGSGKSSLVSLIPRFYDVTAGRVTIGGVDVRDLSQAELRRCFGIALQDTILFSGAIADNIRQGKPDADADALDAAAVAAQAAEFISALPEGYETQLGERGVNLSGGQKQRVAIARALVRQPDILILDDSTSAVDVETEARIQASLDKLMAGRTSFVVAQRISTVLRADKILVLDDGKKVAEGTHAELLACSPIYREIYESQLGSGALAAVRNGAGEVSDGCQ
jgi:ATP-binding cassette, subfamily B, multidrug efflux pump